MWWSWELLWKIMIGKTERFLGALCYLPFFFIFVIFINHKPFVVFHIKQGFVISFLWLLWLYLYHFIPYIGWYVIGPLGFLFLVFLSIFGVIKSLSGSMEPLPFVGNWVEKLRL